jgi:hypothetical protein
VYVDGRIGVDTNAGTKESPVHSIAWAAELLRRQDNAIYTMKLLPGIHVLDKPVLLATEKDMTGKRIVVTAATLPDDPAWTPEKMPIVINSSDLGDFSAEVPSYVVSFSVDESHVTIDPTLDTFRLHDSTRPRPTCGSSGACLSATGMPRIFR